MLPGEGEKNAYRILVGKLLENINVKDQEITDVYLSLRVPTVMATYGLDLQS
jgi:hypothetical protein